VALGRERIETEFLTPSPAPPAPAAGSPCTRGRSDDAWGWVQGAGRLAAGRDRSLSLAASPAGRLAAGWRSWPRPSSSTEIAPTLHVTWTQTGLDVDVTGVEARSGGLSADARTRAAEIARTGALRAVTWRARSCSRPASRWSCSARPPLALPAGRLSCRRWPRPRRPWRGVAARALDGASRVADLFCGVGAFALRLAQTASVYAADSSGAVGEGAARGQRDAGAEGCHRRGA